MLSELVRETDIRPLLKNLNRLPNYFKAFGVASGMLRFCQMYGAPADGHLFSVRVDQRRVHLRRSVSDTSIFFQIFVKREYDTAQWPQHETLQAQYRAILSQGRTPIIIDAGANIGLAALWFGERYPDAIIYAVEPDPANMQVLQRNVSSNPRIIPILGAVWDQSGQLRITNPDAGSGAFRVAEDAAGVVRAVSIPELVAGKVSGRLFIAKIDIEGGEAALFRSNTGWVRDAALITIELHDWLYPGEHTSQNFMAAVSSVPVDFMVRGENVFCFRSG